MTPVARLLCGLLVLAAAITFAPMVVPMLFAAWFAHLFAPLVGWLARHLGGRRRLAAGITLTLLLVILAPLASAMVSLVFTAIEFVKRIAATPEARAALQSLVSDGGSGDLGPRDLLDPHRLAELVREHGQTAWGLLKSFAGAATAIVLQLFVFVICAYAWLVDGDASWGWLVERAPLEARILERLRAAFHETGRGLLVGEGLTALAQGLVAYVTYVVLDVPRALVLAQLTFFGAFVPTVGTAIVWVPVALGLVLSGQLGAAAMLAGAGILVIGAIDNLLRPVLSRWGRLDLPVFVLILAIFGGFAVFGAWGFLLGPLSARLAREALDIVRDERLAAASRRD